MLNGAAVKRSGKRKKVERKGRIKKTTEKRRRWEERKAGASCCCCCCYTGASVRVLKNGSVGACKGARGEQHYIHQCTIQRPQTTKSAALESLSLSLSLLFSRIVQDRASGGAIRRRIVRIIGEIKNEGFPGTYQLPPPRSSPSSAATAAAGREAV